MTKGRLEAFSDGVFAIIITIMVLELHVPHGASFSALRQTLPVFLSYVLSFLYVGVYWNNYHHLLQASKRVNGQILWANLHLLFWLSLIPFTTAWLGENGPASGPVALYGCDLLLSGFAYFLLTKALIREHGPESEIARLIGRDWKGLASVCLYALALPLAFCNARAACACYAFVLLLWFLPDKRIERKLKEEDQVAPERAHQ